MLSIVNSHIAFLTSAAPGLLAAGTYASTMSNHVDQIARSVKAIAGNRIELVDAASAIEAVQGSCFTPEQKVSLTIAIACIF